MPRDTPHEAAVDTLETHGIDSPEFRAAAKNMHDWRVKLLEEYTK